MTLRHMILAGAAAIWFVAALVPAHHWVDTQGAVIGDLIEGRAPIHLTLSGARRAFVGSASTVLRDIGSGRVIAEHRIARGVIRVGDQWNVAMEPARSTGLAPGRYQLETCWTVFSAFRGLVPAKSICAASNAFEVYPSVVHTARLRWPSNIFVEQ